MVESPGCRGRRPADRASRLRRAVLGLQSAERSCGPLCGPVANRVGPCPQELQPIEAERWRAAPQWVEDGWHPPPFLYDLSGRHPAALAQVVEWEASTGRGRVLPLCTALVMVLFALRPPPAPWRRHILRSGERFRRLFDEVKDADGMA